MLPLPQFDRLSVQSDSFCLRKAYRYYGHLGSNPEPFQWESNIRTTRDYPAILLIALHQLSPSIFTEDRTHSNVHLPLAQLWTQQSVWWRLSCSQSVCVTCVSVFRQARPTPWWSCTWSTCTAPPTPRSSPPRTALNFGERTPRPYRVYLMICCCRVSVGLPVCLGVFGCFSLECLENS